MSWFTTLATSFVVRHSPAPLELMVSNLYQIVIPTESKTFVNQYAVLISVAVRESARVNVSLSVLVKRLTVALSPSPRDESLADQTTSQQSFVTMTDPSSINAALPIEPIASTSFQHDSFQMMPPSPNLYPALTRIAVTSVAIGSPSPRARRNQRWPVPPLAPPEAVNWSEDDVVPRITGCDASKTVCQTSFASLTSKL